MKTWISSLPPRRAGSGVRKSLLALALISCLGLPLAGQQGGAGDEEASGSGSAEALELYAYNLEHRDAQAALGLVLPLLSSLGTVEIQPGGNALVVRDTADVLGRVRPRLRAFDHPAASLRIRVQIVRAGAPVEGAGRPDLPAPVLARLKQLLRYESYSLIARSEFQIVEGMKARQDVGDDFAVDFRLKEVTVDDRAVLESFRLSRVRDGELEALIHTNLSLDTTRPMVLGLARTEASGQALMVVIEGVREATLTADAE